MLTDEYQSNRLFELAKQRLALNPGALDKFLIYVAVGMRPHELFVVRMNVNPRVSDYVLENGQFLTPEQAEVKAFDSWAIELIDNWHRKHFARPVQPLPPPVSALPTPIQTVFVHTPQPAQARLSQRGDRDALAPLIRKAQTKAESERSNPGSAAVIFGILKQWARKEKAERPAPLLDVIVKNDAEVIRWEKWDGSSGTLTIHALRKRMERRKPPAGGR